jgi:hypothetical protein
VPISIKVREHWHYDPPEASGDPGLTPNARGQTLLQSEMFKKAVDVQARRSDQGEYWK